MSGPLLDVCAVSMYYGSMQALDRVSFSVHEGEIFGLLGPNGAGKTTLLSIISCLLEPTQGEVRVMGRQVSTTDREVRRLIGVVPQELAIYQELTARENLDFFGELYGVPRAERKRRIDEILTAIGLTDRANHRVSTFSGGMKRRLNLGVALMHAPRLLLLDEPTVGVDPQSRNHIFEEVRRLNRAGMTIIYTSHYMEEVEELCTRVGIMDRGQLQACDTVPGLLRELRGLIRFRVSSFPASLLGQLKTFPDSELFEREDNWELECNDVKGTLGRLIKALIDSQLELLHLETEEPNLERVFLHRTGRALRD